MTIKLWQCFTLCLVSAGAGYFVSSLKVQDALTSQLACAHCSVSSMPKSISEIQSDPLSCESSPDALFGIDGGAGEQSVVSAAHLTVNEPRLFDVDVNDRSIDNIVKLESNQEESHEKGNLVFKLRRQLIHDMQSDPSLIEDVIDAYYQSHSEQVQNTLLESLSEVKSELVETLAIELATSGDRGAMITGLKMVRGQNPNSAPAQQLTTGLLQQHQNSEDMELVLTIMESMPTHISPLESKTVIQAIQPYLDHDMADVRESALANLGKLSRNMNDLAPVLNALSTRDKVPAALAIYHSSVVSEELSEILIDTLANDTEDSTVREVAFESLKRFQLTDQQHALLLSYQGLFGS